MRSVKCFALAVLVAMAAALALWPVSPASAEPVKLSYANFPPASTFPCVQMERWKQEVEKQSHGKVVVETYPGGTLLGAKNMLSGVMQGQADIGCLCMSYQPGVFPLTTVLGVPVGFTKSTVASMVLWDLWEKYQPKEFSGVKVLALFTTAPSNIMSKVPVRSIADLKGLELRASGGASRVLSMLGAVPVSMPMPETPDALQKGLVQGLLSSLEVLMDFNFAEYCRYETLTNFQVYPFAVVMNKDKWSALPADVKAVFDDLRAEQSLWTGKYMDEHVEESLAWSKEKYQIEVISLPDDEQAQALEVLSGMVDDWKKGANDAGVPADAVFSDMLSLKAKYEKEYGR